MVVVKAFDPGKDREVLVIGLTEKNLKDLREGQALLVNNEQFAGVVPRGMEVRILTGKDDQEIKALVERMSSSTPAWKDGGGD